MHGIRDQQRAQPGPHNDEELGRLNEHGQVPLLHQKAADDSSEDQKNSDNGKHFSSPLSRRRQDFRQEEPVADCIGGREPLLRSQPSQGARMMPPPKTSLIKSL